LEDRVRARLRRDFGGFLIGLVREVRSPLVLLRERHRGQQGQTSKQDE
jgi:hypothetical protein